MLVIGEKTNASNEPVAEAIPKRDEEFWQTWPKLRHSEDRGPEIRYEFEEQVLKLDQPSGLTIH